MASFIYKPRKSQADAAGTIVRELSQTGIDVTLSRFYEYATDKLLESYRAAPEQFSREYVSWLHRQKTRGEGG